MDDMMQLPPELQGHLLRVLESSIPVRTRAQLFKWAQGQLQAIAPHGLMTCLVLDDALTVQHTHCLQGVVIAERALAHLNDPVNGMVLKVARRCRKHGLTSMDFTADQAAQVPLFADVAQEWDQLKLGHALFLDTGSLAGEMSSFFALLGLCTPPDAAQHLVLRALVPQLHVSLLRVQHQLLAQTPAPVAPAESPVLTDRQAEVLHWVQQGKTNFEIALILDISVLTVKNHLQKLFKRLNVHNRVQAVARHMEMGELSK
jgi:transcriptional regulator EpsA